MGFLDFIFGKEDSPKKSTIHDDFFGDLELVVCKPDPSKNFFFVARYFEPADENVAIMIAASAAGPTQQQKDFFRSVEANYALISESIIPILEDTFGNWQEGFKIADFKAEFAIESMRLPSCATNPVAWDIAFESIHDENHVYTVLMNDFTARELQIDG